MTQVHLVLIPFAKPRFCFKFVVKLKSQASFVDLEL